MAIPGYYELYRRSTIGNSLVDALDTLISEGRIEASLAMRVLETFDRCVSEILKEQTSSKLTVKGDLDTYGFCDDVWTFIVKNCSVSVENVSINSLLNINNSNNNNNIGNSVESGENIDNNDNTSNSNNNNNNNSNSNSNNSNNSSSSSSNNNKNNDVIKVDKLRIVACNSRRSE